MPTQIWSNVICETTFNFKSSVVAKADETECFTDLTEIKFYMKPTADVYISLNKKGLYLLVLVF